MPLDFSEYEYLEKVADQAPSRASFSFDGGSRASMPYFLDGTSDTLAEQIQDILGSVEPSGSGRLTRTLPRAHPTYEGFFAVGVSSLTGLGKPSLVTIDDPFLEAPRIVDAYAEYPVYLAMVEFAPLPYYVLQDETIEVEEMSWYDEAGDTQVITVASEQDRFCDVEVVPASEMLAAQTGYLQFVRGDGTPSDPLGVTSGTPAPHAYTFSGFPSMWIPKSNVKIRWYRVPESYVASSSSYLREFQGKVNQTTFTCGRYSFLKGTLLYLNYTQKRYTPPIPERSPFDGTISAEKIVDLELNFLLIERTSPSAPTPSNPNYIAAGHNLMPWINGDRSFYYVQSATTPSHPLYKSREFQQLFTDPEV